MKKKTAVDHFGTETAVAKALGISKSAVNQWPETIPELRALQLERITNGVLKASDPRHHRAA